MLQLFVYFILIVALLAAGLYLTRSGFNFIPRKARGDRKLVISETRTLGNRQFLIVAEYENRKMLLGVCPGRIDYLATLSGGGDETFSTELPEKPE
jgi:flagellar protein FliO/FliZ